MILVVPGILTHAKDYQLFTSQLNGDVIVTKVPGSSQSKWDLDLIQMATDLFDFILTKNINSFILIGFDIGGIVALQLSLLLNGRDDIHCKKLVLVNSFAMTPSRGLIRSTGILEHSVWLEANLNSKWLSKISVPIPTPMELEIAKNQVYCISNVNITDQLSSIHVPTLVIAGTADKMVDCSNSEVISDGIVDCDLKMVDAGHWIHIMAPNELSRLVNEFIQ